MTEKTVLLFLCAVFLRGIDAAAKLPADVEICSRSDPKNEECLIRATQKVLELFKDGNKEFNFPPIDPMKVSELTFGEGTGPVNVVQNYKNLEFHGYLPTTIQKFGMSIEGDNVIIKLETLNPSIKFLADYNMKGRVLLLPAHGEGKCNLTFANMHLEHTMEGKVIQKDGNKHIKVEKYALFSSPEKAAYYFENLFDGDPVLGPQMNQLINDNWKEIYEDVQQGYDKALGFLFKDYANKIFLKVPLDDLLKP